MSEGPPWPSQWRCLRADLDRYLELTPGYPHHSLLRKLRVAVAEESFWVIAWYRFGRWLILECRVPVLRPLLLAVHTVGFRLLRLLFGISLSRTSDVGPGLYFGHWGGVWINPGVSMGHHVTIAHGVTIGVGGTGALAGVPHIGNHVFIAPHAVLAGKITVGDGSAIGANSTIIAPVPGGASVIGVPGRIIARGANPVAERASVAPTADAPASDAGTPDAPAPSGAIPPQPLTPPGSAP